MSTKKCIEATESKTPTQNIDRDFKRKIDFLRKKLKLTKAAFAQKIGYSTVHLYRIEIGECAPTQEMIETIVKVFNLDPRWPSLGERDNPFLEGGLSDTIDSLGSAGDRLLQWRKEKGMLQKDLAAIADISLPNLVAVEHGRRKMTVRLAKKIENACDISVAWLLHGDEQIGRASCRERV